MKKKEFFHNIEYEWENFVSRNKIIKKKQDRKKTVFQETKDLSYHERFFFNPISFGLFFVLILLVGRGGGQKEPSSRGGM